MTTPLSYPDIQAIVNAAEGKEPPTLFTQDGRKVLILYLHSPIFSSSNKEENRLVYVVSSPDGNKTYHSVPVGDDGHQFYLTAPTEAQVSAYKARKAEKERTANKSSL